MGLRIEGHFMTLNKYIKSQSNSIHGISGKGLYAKVKFKS